MMKTQGVHRPTNTVLSNMCSDLTLPGEPLEAERTLVQPERVPGCLIKMSVA